MNDDALPNFFLRSSFLFSTSDPGGIAPWACKTAVNAHAPIEPFKMFYRINKNVKKLMQNMMKLQQVVDKNIIYL